MKLIVIEGIDGAGKSTQIKLIKEFFSGKGYSCEYMHFPRTEAPYFGELIAKFLRGEFGSINDIDPYLVAMLYAGDRRDFSDVIRSWLKEGKMVILDRYTYSNIAYQCAKLEDTDSSNKLMDWIKSLEFDHFDIPKPDLNIFLDVPLSFTEKNLTTARNGSDRSYLKGTTDIHEESILFQKNVRNIYLKVALSDNRLEVIDCSNDNGEILPPDAIFKKILQVFTNKKIIK